MAPTLAFTAFPAVGGPVGYAAVPWDTELYALPFYELRCEGAAAEVERALPGCLEAIRARSPHQPALVFTRMHPADTRLCEVLSGQRFYAAEMTLEITLPLRRYVRPHPHMTPKGVLRAAQETDLPILKQIAGEAFARDRFHLDPHLPHELSDKRYAQWVERGFRNGDQLFAYERIGDAGEIMGFYLIRGAVGGEVELSLAGVAPKYQRSGIGALMYEEMLAWCQTARYRTAITHVSINNLDVVNLFLALGFTIRNAQQTMHRFLEPLGAAHE